MRTSRLIQTVPFVVAVACSMGCATTMVLISEDDYFGVWDNSAYSRIFIGPVIDAEFAANTYFDSTYEHHVDIPWPWRVLAVVDMPLSLAVDTVLLPVSVPLELRDAVMCSKAPSDEKVIIQKSGEEIEIEGEE